MLTPEQQAADEATPPDVLRELTQQSVELARLVAQNPAAMPDLLGELAKSDDLSTREGVATNPNTPIDELLELVAEFPGQILTNPVFSLLLLENPALSQQVPLKTLRQLIKQADVPTSFLVDYTLRETDRNVLLELMMKSDTSPIILQNLSQHYNSDISEAAKLHINLVGEMQAGWYAAARDAVRVEIAQEYRNWKPRAEYYLYVLGWLNFIPEALLLDWINDKNSVCRKFAATVINADTPLAIVQRLTEDEEVNVHLAVAENPNVPATILKKLAKSNHRAQIYYRETKKAKKFFPYFQRFQPRSLRAKDRIIFLIELMNIFFYWISFVLFVLGWWVPFFISLVIPSSPLLIWAIFFGVFTSIQAILISMKHHDKHPIIEEVLKLIKRRRAQNPKATVEVLTKLASDSDIEVRRRVAWNPSVPYQLLGKIFSDNKISSYIDSYANIPDHLLRFLLIQQGRDCHNAIKKHLIRSNPYYLNLVLEGYAKCEHLIVRILVLLQPQMPIHILLKKSQSLVWLERYAVAQNSSTPMYTLEELAQDGNRIVRAAAKANFNNQLQ